MADRFDISQRKKDHLALCAGDNVGFREKGTLLHEVELVHCALPEIHADEVDSSVELLGKTLEAPVVIAAMTGGTDEAAKILDAYFAAFPSVKEFMERTVAEARDRGYTETVFGRRRRIPELSSGQRNVRMAGERQAMNAPIQGLAADIFKVALVRLDRAIDERGLGSRLILQVHDEVLVEVPDGELDDAVDVVTHAMSGAFDLSVPLAVNLSHGSSWAAAKG